MYDHMVGSRSQTLGIPFFFSQTPLVVSDVARIMFALLLYLLFGSFHKTFLSDNFWLAVKISHRIGKNCY